MVDSVSNRIDKNFQLFWITHGAFGIKSHNITVLHTIQHVF